MAGALSKLLADPKTTANQPCAVISPERLNLLSNLSYNGFC